MFYYVQQPIELLFVKGELLSKLVIASCNLNSITH